MDPLFDIFKIDYENIKPGQGRILISDPFLNDAYFKRSIVFLTEHNKNGTVGFVLNKPVEVDISEILADFPPFDGTISIGGPVGTDAVHYIHTVGKLIPGSVKVLPDIFWGGEFEVVKQLLKEGMLNSSNIRFFVGYSGWQPMQLERELSENSWVVTELDSRGIMETRSRESWKNVLNSLGGKFRIWTNFPENPGMN